MIDLETRGNKPNSPIISIGDVFFEPETGKLGCDFYPVVTLKSAVKDGAAAMSISIVLIYLNRSIRDNTDPEKVQVWGDGARFDNVILRSSYDSHLIPSASEFWNDRDVITMVEFGKAIDINPRHDIPFEDDMHNLLADAMHQGKYVSAIWQRLIPTSKISEA